MRLRCETICLLLVCGVMTISEDASAATPTAARKQQFRIVVPGGGGAVHPQAQQEGPHPAVPSWRILSGSRFGVSLTVLANGAPVASELIQGAGSQTVFVFEAIESGTVIGELTGLP